MLKQIAALLRRKPVEFKIVADFPVAKKRPTVKKATTKIAIKKPVAKKTSDKKTIKKSISLKK
jgi:hypothetical protein